MATGSVFASQIFWSGYNLGQNDGIYRADGDGSNVVQIITAEAFTPLVEPYYVGLPTDLAFDPDNQLIYTISTADDIIWKTDLTGSQFENVHAMGETDPHQMEVDFVTQQIFWIEDNGPTAPARIGRCGLDGSAATYIITNAGSRAGGIALDALNGYVFWTETYYFSEPTNMAVRRCELDGANAQAIVTNFAEGAFELGSIAVDPASQKVYWLQDHSLIRRADYDGLNPETLYEEEAIGDRSGLVVDGVAGELFWTSLATSTIGRATLDGSSNAPLIENLPSGPLGITLVSGEGMDGTAPVIKLDDVTDSSIAVSWSAPVQGWRLESSTTLAPDSWIVVPTNQITVEGTNGTAILNIVPPRLFVRLHNVGP